jgi:hypothetical protein
LVGIRSLPIEVSQVDEVSRGKERLADVADGALDAPFLVAASDGDGARFKAVMRGERQERRMEPDRIAMAFEDGALQIVVEKNARHAAERFERIDVTTQEVRHGCARKEAQEEPARVAQHHDEGPERALGLTHLKLAEVRPVDLRLFTGQRPEPLERLGRFARTVTTDDAPEVIAPAGVAACFDHFKEPARSKSRVLLELLDDERHERVSHRWPRGHDLRFHADLAEHALHRRVVHAELRRDRADRPLLAME